MRRPVRASLAAAAIAISATACVGTTPRREPPPNRVIAQNLAVDHGSAVRVAVAPSEPFAHLLVTFTPASAGLMLCPLRALDATLPPVQACRADVGSGVRETVTVPGLRAVAVVATRGDITADVTVEYTGPSREISVVLPRAAAPAPSCEDVDCWPLIEVTPPRDGAFRASATWSGPRATLVLLQGRILARSARATGLPYREEARTDGGSPLTLTGRLSQTGEYALVLRDERGGAVLRDVRIDARWP